MRNNSRTELVSTLLKGAFTLVELMISMAIIGVLSSMVLAVVTVAGAANDRSSTDSLIGLLSSGIDIFKIELGLPPLASGDRSDAESASWYPDTTDGTWEKQQLWWRLSKPMEMQDKLDMYAAMEAKSLEKNQWQSFAHIDAKFPNDADAANENQRIVNEIPDADADKYKTANFVDNTHSRWVSADLADTTPDASHQGFHARGWIKIYLIQIQEQLAVEQVQRSYFTYPALSVGEIDADFIDGDTLLDAWGNPLMYVCEVKSALSGKMVPNRGQQRSYKGIIPVEHSGFKRADITDRNDDTIINDEDWGMAPLDATLLLDWDGNAVVDEHDWGSMRYNCRPGNGKGYLLASAGDDELFDLLWARPVNADNLLNPMSE